MKNCITIIADVSFYFLSAILTGVVFNCVGNKDVSVIQFAVGSTVGWLLFRFIRYLVSVCIHEEKDV